MQDGFQALISNRMLLLMPRPVNANVINCIWLYKKKKRVHGSPSRYKAHLVANGCS